MIYILPKKFFKRQFRKLFAAYNESLRKLFEKLTSYNLKGHKSMCKTAVNELIFLIYVVSSDEIKASSKKAYTIIKIPQLTNKIELKKVFWDA